MSTSFWQKKRLVTYTLFDLCLFKHFSLSQIFVISLYVNENKMAPPKIVWTHCALWAYRALALTRGAEKSLVKQGSINKTETCQNLPAYYVWYCSFEYVSQYILRFLSVFWALLKEKYEFSSCELLKRFQNWKWNRQFRILTNQIVLDPRLVLLGQKVHKYSDLQFWK